MDLPLRNELQHFGVIRVLCLVDMRLEDVDRLVMIDGHFVLEDDGALVVLLVGKVNRDARHVVARVVGVLNRMRAAVLGKQRRMQVDDAVGIRVEKHRRHLAHVARHDDVLDAARLEQLHHLAVHRLGVGVVRRLEDDGVDARFLGLGDALRVAVGGDDVFDARIELAVADGVDDRHHVRAGARDENCNLHAHSSTRRSRCPRP